MKRKLVLASHGGLAHGLLDTAEMIVGKLPYEVEVYSLQPGNLAEDYAKELKKEILQQQDCEYLILTDIYGASVFTAMLSCIEAKNARLFAGMNLNMLLAICLEHPQWLQDEDIEQILQDSRSGIQVAQMLQDCEDEEF